MKLGRNEVYLKCINLIIKNGKKRLAVKHFFNAFAFIKHNFKTDPVNIFFSAIQKLMPIVSVKKRYKAGQTCYIPYVLTDDVRVRLALRWLIKAARERVQGQAFFEKLAFEMYEASQHKGEAIKLKQQLYALVVRHKTNLREV